MKLKNNLEITDEIPTSSTADIAFLLVVFFMLTSVFSVAKGLDFAVPEDVTDEEVVPEEAVLVEVIPGGQLRVDQRPMELENLLEYLAPKLERNPSKPVIIRPDPYSEYKFMVEVLDVLRQGKETLGLERDIEVAIPTEREIESFWW